MPKIKNKPYEPVRLKLKDWLEFEKLQEDIQQAVKDKNSEQYAGKVLVLLSSVLKFPIDEIIDAPWFEVVEAYVSITKLNQVKEIPLLKSDPSKMKKEAWEYDGRTWFWWVNLFAKNYGWTIEVIKELDIDDAVSFLQEILVDEQLDREWQWDLSELAYPYNKTTKKSEYKPLPRPSWMEERKVFLPATKVKFRKSMLPVGMVVGESGNERIVN